MRIEVSLSNKIANMSFVCAVLIVIMHVWPVCEGDAIISFVRKWVCQGVADIAVPVFFVISGFFLGLHLEDEHWYSRAVRKRVWTLVIPFYALNLLWFPIKYGVHYVAVRWFGAGAADPTMDFTWMNFLLSTSILPWGWNVVLGTWYIKALFFLVLISPVFVWIVKKGRLQALGLILVLLSLWTIQMQLLPEGESYFRKKMLFELCFRCPLFFVIGLFLSRFESRCKNWPTSLIVVAGLVALICRINITGFPAGIRTIIRFVTICLVASATWKLMPSNKWPPALVGNSFALYVFHGAVMFILEACVKAVGLSDVVCKTPLGGFCEVAVVLVLSLCIAEFIRCKMPAFSRIVFGGR